MKFSLHLHLFVDHMIDVEFLFLCDTLSVPMTLFCSGSLYNWGELSPACDTLFFMITTS